MPPNTFDLPIGPDPEMMNNETISKEPPRLVVQNEDNYALKIFQSSLNLLAHVLIGANVAVVLSFVFINFGLPLRATPLHITLCVLGYQLLMAQAILSLSSENGWTSRFRLVDKRRVHWILQILGSGLAIGGSFHKILDKTVHWNSLHGQFALVALVFTVVSLFNGLASLWAYELRGMVPGTISKITHVCFGTVAFAASSICLCIGYRKSMFRNWATEPLSYTFVAIIAVYTCIIIVNPLITFYKKSKLALKRS